MHKLLVVAFLLCGIFHNGFSQVPMERIMEDKNDMADAYYGTFKYLGAPYTGNAIAYHENGKIKTLRGFKDGMYHGMWTEWYANGNRKFQGDRWNNKGQGPTKWWYENGQLKKMGTYEKDIQEGVIIWWYPNGNLKLIRHYRNGVPFGGWTTFDENGEVLDEGDDEHLFYRPFFGNNSRDHGREQTSPSFTADGKTMVFARYTDWMKKQPYIARWEEGKWQVEPLSFAETVYNLAISPKGDRIVYKQYVNVGEEEVTKAFVVDKRGGAWQEPMEVKTLFKINAGYFQIMEDGMLFMFARKPRKGIFYASPDKQNIYSKPVWFSDDLSPENCTAFDVHLHPNRNKLIITQVDFPKAKKEQYGEPGLYYFKKQGQNWERVKRIPLGYAWGASVTGEEELVFVRNSDIYKIPLKDLGIDW